MRGRMLVIISLTRTKLDFKNIDNKDQYVGYIQCAPGNITVFSQFKMSSSITCSVI